MEEMDVGADYKDEWYDTEVEGGGRGVRLVGDLLTLEATGNLTKDAETGGTKLVDAHNGFNDLSRLAMFCMVLHCWRTGVRFTFN